MVIRSACEEDRTRYARADEISLACLRDSRGITFQRAFSNRVRRFLAILASNFSFSLTLVSLRIYHPRTVIWFIRAYFALAQRLSPNTRAYLADLSIGNSCIKGWDRSAAQAPPRNPILNFGPWLRLYFHYRRTAVLANILAHRWPEGNVLFFSFFFPTPSPQSDFVDRINRAKRRV